MTAGWTEAWADADGRQLTVSISMNGFHKEGIPRIQAFLRAGFGVLRACRIQACNKIKHLNKQCSSASLSYFWASYFVKTFKLLLGRSDELFPGCTDCAPEWFLPPLTSTAASLPCPPPLFHSPLAVLYLKFLGCKAMTELQIGSDRMGTECLGFSVEKDKTHNTFPKCTIICINTTVWEMSLKIISWVMNLASQVLTNPRITKLWYYQTSLKQRGFWGLSHK